MFIGTSIMSLIVLAIFLALPLIWFFGTYNALIGLRNHVENAWAQIDTELKRRHDLIPNLVDTVKGYAKHEREVFERLVEARTRAQSLHDQPAAQSDEENQVSTRLSRLFALAEGYPELKASENFLQLQEELANTEDRLQAARRFYNGNVRDLNTMVESFPAMIVASVAGFRQADYFEVDSSAVRQAPRVDVQSLST